MSRLGGWFAVVAAVIARPRLWGTALRQLFVLARPGWWGRPPFLPVPPSGYLRFRMVTAYGDADRRPEPHDVVVYLEWCREWRAVM